MRPIITVAAVLGLVHWGLDAVFAERAQREAVIGGPCEGCEAVFDGLPDSLSWHSRLAPPSEPGEPLRIEGTVRNARGRPVAGVIVYGYHTDQRGIYPRDEELRGRSGFRHGKLRGWAKTDEEGRYRFDTIRPASYPDTRIPQHIHMHVIEVGCCTYYISDIHFDDDPYLPAAARRRSESGRGGNGVVKPRREKDGVWVATRDIVLGKGVPGYDTAPRAGANRNPPRER